MRRAPAAVSYSGGRACRTCATHEPPALRGDAAPAVSRRGRRLLRYGRGWHLHRYRHHRAGRVATGEAAKPAGAAGAAGSRSPAAPGSRGPATRPARQHGGHERLVGAARRAHGPGVDRRLRRPPDPRARSAWRPLPFRPRSAPDAPGPRQRPQPPAGGASGRFRGCASGAQRRRPGGPGAPRGRQRRRGGRRLPALQLAGRPPRARGGDGPQASGTGALPEPLVPGPAPGPRGGARQHHLGQRLPDAGDAPLPGPPGAWSGGSAPGGDGLACRPFGPPRRRPPAGGHSALRPGRGRPGRAGGGQAPRAGAHPQPGHGRHLHGCGALRGRAGAGRLERCRRHSDPSAQPAHPHRRCRRRFHPRGGAGQAAEAGTTLGRGLARAGRLRARRRQNRP